MRRRRVISALLVRSRVAGRAAEAALVVLALATLVFLALRILPGDPAEACVYPSEVFKVIGFEEGCSAVLTNREEV